MAWKTTLRLFWVVVLIQGITSQQEQNLALSTVKDRVLTALLETVPSIRGAALKDFDINNTCPQLWDKNSEFNATAGYLGSLQEVYNFCDGKQPICEVAKWISSYLCNASQGLRYGDSYPKPPLVRDFADLKNTTNLCLKLGNKDLKTNIATAVQSNGGSRIQNFDAFFNELHAVLTDNCPSACSHNNLRACQVILQGLRTIAEWEYLKKNLSSSPNEVAETTTIKAPAIKTALNNTNLSNSSVVLPPISSQVEDKVPQTSTSTLAAVALTEKIPELVIPTLSPVEESEEELNPPPENPADIDLDQEAPKAIEEYDEDDAEVGMEDSPTVNKKPDTEQAKEPVKSIQEPRDYYMDQPQDTHFIIYFLVCMVLVVFGYLLYHRRTQVVALIIEGRGGSNRRRSNSRSRGSSASYKRLDNNLEEVVTSSRAVKSSNVIY